MAQRPEPIHAHAMENLQFIRNAMSRATEFTAVPGWGGVMMGVTAMAAAALSGPPDESLRWMMIWLGDAAIAAAIAASTSGACAGVNSTSTSRKS